MILFLISERLYYTLHDLRYTAPLISEINLLRKFLLLPMTMCISVADLLPGVWYPSVF